MAADISNSCLSILLIPTRTKILIRNWYVNGVGGVDRSVGDSLHDGSLIVVVAASGFLGIFGLQRGLETLRCLHM
jgi:hypothetical protein